MFYGNPDPASIPALGMNTQASNGCGGPLGSWQKYNADGEYEVGSVTFKFDRKVTDPILDLSGLGGYVSRVGSYAYNGQMYLVGMGSFNSTNLHLATEGITVEPLTANSNLTVVNNVIQVKERNTYTRAEVDNGGYNWIQFQDDYGRQYNINSPYLAPAGTGSVKLKGTFDEVTFKLYHQATPYSKFSQAEYKTHPSYFANYGGATDPSHGDKINGMNVINTESVHIGGKWFNGDQNWDLFRASLRLPKPSSIGDKVWLDIDANGTQDAGEEGVAGVTVKLLDKDGNPAKDFNGNTVEDQVTDAEGNYKFENLAAGEYTVQIEPNKGQKLTEKAKSTDNTIDSDFDSETKRTAPITLEPNQEKTDIDAGLVEENTYKVDYEFQPSKEPNTPSELPQGVKDQLPKPVENLEDGKSVPSPTKFTAVKDEENGGTWTFEKWDKETATIKGADEHVTGTWKFTKDEAPKTDYKVDYEFKPSKAAGTPSELPQGVKDQLPKPVENLEDGKSVPSPTKFTPVKDEVNGGTWTFESWDKETATIKGADEHVTGTWKFTKDEEPQPGDYKVTHEFKSGTEGKTLPEGVTKLLPSDQTGKKDGEEVRPTKPAKTEVPVEGGKWVFEGYDNTSSKINKADAHFVGTWVFKEDKTPQPETNKGNVYVEYVAEDGTVLDEKSVVKENAPVGEDYKTELKSFKGYEFARMKEGSAPANGTVKKGNQTVTYVYKKTKITPPVEETGNVYVKYVTEDEKVLEAESIVKKDAPVGEHYTTEQKIFNGYVFKGMSADSAGANGNVVKGDLYVTYVYKQVKDPVVDPDGKTGNVYVNYVTVDGKTLQGPTTVKENAPVGEAYTTQRLNFDGYEFVRMGNGSADANGNVLEVDQYVTYVYKPIETPQVKTGNVYVKYVTEDGKVLEAEKSVVTNAKVGTEYKTELKSFDDYEFVKMADGSADANGNVVEGDLHVVYVYRKKSTPKPPTPSTETGNVYVKYVTEDGTVLYEGTVKKDAKIGEKYTTEKKEFDGYEFVRMDKNSAAKNGSVTKEDQTVVYVYKKKGNAPTPTVDKITKFVDEKGNEISKSTKGDNPKKDIDGYEFVRTETDKNGNTVHIYKKKGNTSTPTVEKITKFVDEKGNEISKSTKGGNPKKDIDGYEFVKTEIDKNGNTVHIYKKKDSRVTIPAYKEYKVSYEFVSATVGKKLPQEVLDLLPSSESGKKDGDKISATKPSKTKVEVKDGTWEFVSYDKDSKTVDKADVKFVGKWVFKENTKKPGVSTGETTKPNKDNKPNTSTGTVSPGKTTVVPGSTTINQANKKVRGNVTTGVGSSIGALVTLAGSALALFKSKKRK